MTKRKQLRKVTPYGPIRIMENGRDEYVATNLLRYSWTFKLYTHFHPLDITRPAEFLGMISTILEKMKSQGNLENGTMQILQHTTEFLKIVLAVKPLSAKDVMDNQELNNFLTSLENKSIPRMLCDEPLRPTTIMPDGFQRSMKSVVSNVLEGCIFATAKIEIFCNLQKAVCKKIISPSNREKICKFKGIEMMYVILDRSYLK